MCLIKKTAVRILCIALFLLICIFALLIILLGVRDTTVDLKMLLIIYLAVSVVILCVILLICSAKRTVIRILSVVFLLLIYFLSCVYIIFVSSGKDDFFNILCDFSCERVGFGDLTFPGGKGMRESTIFCSRKKKVRPEAVLQR